MTATYEKIATTTLGSAASEIVFTSISGSYTDLVIVADCQTTAGNTFTMRFNSDSGTNYSQTVISGDGSSASSFKSTNISSLYLGDITNARMVYLINIMNYKNTAVNKTILVRQNYSAGSVTARSGLWRNTAAITSIRLAPFSAVDLLAGSVATLYGIKAE